MAAFSFLRQNILQQTFAHPFQAILCLSQKQKLLSHVWIAATSNPLSCLGVGRATHTARHPPGLTRHGPGGQLKAEGDKMADLKTFEKAEFGSVRVVIRESEPWFVAKDVCDCLELGNSRDAVSGLDDDEKGVAIIDTLGGPQEMTVISEPGLYSLILRSRKPEAKVFKRWITHEVIPSIRRHGGYLTPAKLEEALLNPDTLIRLATDLKAEREKRAALEQQVRTDAPKVLFADSVSASSSSILVGQLAVLLRQNGVNIGQNRLFQWMRENGFLIQSGSRKNSPTQRSMELGLFETKERTINNPDGSIRITMTTKVTGKGQVYFVNRFLRPDDNIAA